MISMVKKSDIIQKGAYMLIPLLWCVFGCKSNNKPVEVGSSRDSVHQEVLNKEGIKADSIMTANASTDLRLFLSKYYQKDIDQNLLDSGSRKFIYSEYDLNQDGKNEIFIGLTGGYFCGSGGCTVLLLDSNRDLITKFTVADYPFTVLSSTTNNWKDLIVRSRGKQHILKFNGKAYPSNPSIQPEFSEKSIQGDQVLERPVISEQWQKF
jgi:hypothetical protein